MSAHPIRVRRLLSMSRRSGLQVDADAALGRAPRHALGWRDMQDQHAAAHGIVVSVAIGAVVWTLLFAVLWLGMAIL